eukprot:scaffold319_cov244-Pinguiococcus_pyrenoidosus.AAC.26
MSSVPFGCPALTLRVGAATRDAALVTKCASRRALRASSRFFVSISWSSRSSRGIARVRLELRARVRRTGEVGTVRLFGHGGQLRLSA